MTEVAKLRVALADDHLLMLEGLVALIRETPDMEFVGQATTGPRACAMIRDLKPDIAVLDICMPEMNGFAVAQRAAEEGSGARLIGLSFNEDRLYFKQAMEVGLRGYVLKRSAAENLLFAIRSVARGGFYIDPILAGQVMGLSSRGHGRSIATRPNANEPELTVREEEVLRLIALGFTIKEAAGLLGVTDKSIETYKARAAEKLKLGSRARIVQYGVSHGWFQEAQGGTTGFP
jgi:DNA-binding NarL/FixJ family response regulator